MDEEISVDTGHPVRLIDKDKMGSVEREEENWRLS